MADYALNTLLTLTLALPLAMWVDQLIGEPPEYVHPVVWIGRYLNQAGRRIAPTAADTSSKNNRVEFWKGTAAWIIGVIGVGLIASLLQVALLQLPWWIAGPLVALMLKPMLAWRMLREETMAVETALGESLELGRTQLARLVSRDVHSLDAREVRESAIESLAENLNDSVIAPIFWFVCLGLPGAAVYRFANTADAMWGYRGARNGRYWEYAGKWAARADDVLSWIPARLTALLLLAASPVRALRVSRQLPSQARLTPSPNSGWPMAAMALLINVRLSKPETYNLNPSGQPAESGSMREAQELSRKAMIAATSIGIVSIYFIVK